MASNEVMRAEFAQNGQPHLAAKCERQAELFRKLTRNARRIAQLDEERNHGE